MMIQLTDLFKKHKVGINVSNIKYLVDYEVKHTKMCLVNTEQYLFIQEPLEEVCEIINDLAKKKTININVYHSKSLFGK